MEKNNKLTLSVLAEESVDREPVQCCHRCIELCLAAGQATGASSNRSKVRKASLEEAQTVKNLAIVQKLWV